MKGCVLSIEILPGTGLAATTGPVEFLTAGFTAVGTGGRGGADVVLCDADNGFAAAAAVVVAAAVGFAPVTGDVAVVVGFAPEATGFAALADGPTGFAAAVVDAAPAGLSTGFNTTLPKPASGFASTGLGTFLSCTLPIPARAFIAGGRGIGGRGGGADIYL